MSVLTVIAGRAQGLEIALSMTPVTLGRDEELPIQIHDQKVSRRHAQVWDAAGRGAVIKDLGSTNGTFVNGRRVFFEVVLNEGDQIVLGGTTMVFSKERFASQQAAIEFVKQLGERRVNTMM